MSDDLSRVFSALADPTRREIVARLVGIGIIAGHIAEQTIDRPRSLPRSAPTTPVIVPRPPLSIAPFRLVPDAELAVFG